MNHHDLHLFIDRLLTTIGALVPEYMKNPLDRELNNGNVSACILDDTGHVYGRMYGDDKAKCRQTFRTAWTKASQVWMTGMKTGEYERKVFNGEIQDGEHGIRKPDLIGWEGGQPIVLADGTRLSAGFSGFRGINDLEIVTRAVGMMEVQ